jgi:hypothetical protein
VGVNEEQKTVTTKSETMKKLLRIQQAFEDYQLGRIGALAGTG